MPDFAVRALTPETWPAWEALVAAHNGVWSGCWCVAFHERVPRPEGMDRPGHAAFNHALKAEMVEAGTTRSAVVFEGEEAIGWAQFGRVAELPRIEHRREYEKGLPVAGPPDWRIPCMFVGRGHRRQGVAEAALRGALEMIAAAGGGLVEGYPEDTAGRRATASFMWAGTVSMFERQGFARDRRIGKHHWVMRREIQPISPST